MASGSESLGGEQFRSQDVLGGSYYYCFVIADGAEDPYQGCSELTAGKLRPVMEGLAQTSYAEDEESWLKLLQHFGGMNKILCDFLAFFHNAHYILFSTLQVR